MKTSIAVILLVLAGSALPVRAAEMPLTGGRQGKFIDRPGTTADLGLVKFSGEPVLVAPPSPLCPARSFVQLRSSNQDNGLVELNCGWWSGSGTSFKYLDRSALSGGVEQIQLKKGQLKIKFRSANYVPLVGPAAWIETRLMVGSSSFCGRFATFKRNEPTLIMATAPSTACAALPGATGTATALATSTPTITRTRTFTPVKTSTSTATLTATPTGTGTATRTRTPTATLTSTGTRTNTPTSTATRTSVPAPDVRITFPTNGQFSTASSMLMMGQVFNPAPGMVVLVNGVPVTVQPDNTFSRLLTLNDVTVFNPIVAEVIAGSHHARDRVVAIRGDSVADGDYSPASIALRVNDSGFNTLEPLLTSMVHIDIGTLVPPGTKIVSGFCAIDTPLGCIQRIDVDVTGASLGGFAVDVDSMTNFIAGNVTLNSIFVGARIHGGIIDCDAELKANSALIRGNYDLLPLASDPNKVDVNQIGGVSVDFSNFSFDFTSGVCDFPLIGDLIDLLVGDVEPTVRNALQGFLNDPDGAGPQDAPIAAAIQTAMGALDIAGPLGQGLGVSMDAPFFGIFEDTAGITLGSDAAITASEPVPGAPVLTRSLQVSQTFPTFGATTPESDQPYDVGICIGASAFNQLLKAEVESGLLRTDITEFDFGTGPLTLTAGLLATLIPELSFLPPDEPMAIQLRPTIAPIVTGNAGPMGELAELRIAQLLVNLVSGPPGHETVQLSVAADIQAGLDLSFDDLTGSLIPGLGLPPNGVTVVVLRNPINADTAAVESLLPLLVAQFLPSVGDSLGTFPIPGFLGVQLHGVEVSRGGQFMSVFVRLQP